MSRERRFVWAKDRSQERFIDDRMSTKLEPTALYRPIRTASAINLSPEPYRPITAILALHELGFAAYSGAELLLA